MRNRRRKIVGDSGGAMGGQVLGLSLFIVLLAFFIVLNAISNYQQNKIAPVLQSLESAFAAKITQDGNFKPSLTPSEMKSINEGDVLERLRTLFVAHIPSYTGKIDRNTGTMRAELGLDEFEKSVMSVGSDAADNNDSLKKFFLPTLVALVKNNALGIPYRMDILVGIDGNPALLENAEPQRMKELRMRINRIAAKIEHDGLPQKLMSIGLKKGKSGTVELFFSPHIPYNPLERENE